MKKILVPLIIAAVTLTYCNKNNSDMSGPSKADQAFSQLKNDPLFFQYLSSISSMMKTIETNISRTKPEDSLLIRNPSLTFKEKYDSLHFSGIEEMNSNYSNSTVLLRKLLVRYPLFASLNNEESKQLYKKAYAYYLNSKQTHP